MNAHRFTLATLATLTLVACASPERSETEPSAAPTSTPVQTNSATPEASVSATGEETTLALEGLGELAVGKPVPAESSFKLRGAQASDTCQLYSSPEYAGVYAIVEDKQVRRITVSRKSPIRLVEGIGVGSTEKEVLAAFPGFKSEPHKYVAAPAKYLTQPGNDPRLRFEIGEDGKVTDVHVGMNPQLSYVEGCA